ncbi:MAG: hypothetical protein J5545_10665 [Bacteroidaceae bacterium]|nr:hypothetical protein [Bacteroidaceae bacterium]
MKHIKYFLPALLCVCGAVTLTFTSCDDMLDMGNDDVLYADDNHLTNGNDTVNSFVGILAQLQKIAVRTNLYGELRGDLTTVNANAKLDLKDIASFSVGDDNAYNDPRDYYSVINNCNYYLANADTLLRESRYNAAAHSTYDFYVFRAEYCAVRAIRAWVYLQLGQIYGENIPLVLNPILSLDDADEALANARKMTLEQICDFFIEDLKPYVPWFTYPYHGNPGYKGYNSEMPSRMAVLPIQLVLGDLYLWNASIKRDQQMARLAAKSYYDYINWVPNDGGADIDDGYKRRSVTYVGDCSWGTSNFTSGEFRMTYSSINSWFDTSHFGDIDDEIIAAIAMDSVSNESHFNELRYLYSYNPEEENVDASLSPSQVCCDYSDSQVYYAVYNNGTSEVSATVSAGQLTDEQVSRHYLGDLRLALSLNRTYRSSDPSKEQQIITKAYYPQDVIIYRKGDIYLRMAEALNYAGFPKFALAILTTGLDNTVVTRGILPLCHNATDSAFVQQFEFLPLDLNTGYLTQVEDYSPSGQPIYAPNASSGNTRTYNWNQIGLHARGSGYALENPFYYDPQNDVPADSTGFPVQPPLFVTNNQTSYDRIMTALEEDNPEIIAAATAAGLEAPDFDAIPTPLEKNNAAKAYRDSLQVFSNRQQRAWQAETAVWYHEYGYPQVEARQLVVVDSLLDVESALETPFEGFRFGYLARDAYRKADPALFAKRVARRDPSLQGLLMDSRNWFVRWNGQIGR